MLLTAIALIAQTAALPADPFAAARTCAQATMIAGVGKTSPIRLTSQFMYYTMHAVRADAGGKTFLARLQELSAAAPSDITDPAAAKALVPACEQRFVRPAAVPASGLPADPFDRDLLCFGTLSMLQGAAQALKEDKGDGLPLERIEAVLTPLTDKLSDTELAKRGINGGDQFTELLGNRIAASMPLGEPIAIAIACGVREL